MPVLDASAILNAFPFKFGEHKYFAVHEVVDELKDFRAKSILEAGIASGKLKVMMPSEESITKVKEFSKGVNLSEADVKTLALALELKEELWTDDFGMVKVAKKLGVRCKGVLFNKL